MHLLISPLSLALSLLAALPTPTTAQSEFMFAYYLPNTACRAHVPPGSAKSQSIPTFAHGQCVKVDTNLDGDFDVEISGKVYWTNGVTPAILACPTSDCDIYEDNGCYEMYARGAFETRCSHMSNTFYWAVGPQGFSIKKDMAMVNGKRINGSYANGTDV